MEKVTAFLRRYLPQFGVAVISSILTAAIILTFIPRGKPDPIGQDSSGNSGTNNASPISLKVPGNPEIFVQVQQQVSPTVVFIKTSKEITVRENVNPFDFFDRFFNQVQPRQPRTEKQNAQGSGFIIDKKGYIITNAHVVSKADSIKVTLSDNREFDAELKGMDMVNDLALLKINATNLPVAKLGNSDKLEPGQWVMAIGNPLGYANTVTAGIISGLQRNIQQPNIPTNLIQTDTAINYGNSGGPLINLKGEVIGINTAIIPYAQGIGFAIPINTAKAILPELRTKGKISHPWLGIYMRPVTQETAEYYNVSPGKGAFVDSVIKNSPAEKGGLQDGDIILEVDKVKVKSPEHLQEIISKTKINNKIKVLVKRDNSLKIITVTIGERPQSFE